MHDTALLAGSLFAKQYTNTGQTVIDVGGQDINGSLRSYFEDIGIKYISVDIEEGKNVDIVIKPGEKLPFEDGSIDAVVSTSCFEHDPCFWMTFRELCRIVKKDGYIYINAPSNGIYHRYPGDNWRFYSDAGQALAYWAGTEINGGRYPVIVEETFHLYPLTDSWIDFICIWKRTDIPETTIIVSDEIKNKIGPLKNALLELNCTIHSTYKELHDMSSENVIILNDTVNDTNNLNH